MARTFEALKRAEEQRRLRLEAPEFPLLCRESDWVEKEKLNQLEETVDELTKIVSDLIASMKKAMEK